MSALLSKGVYYFENYSTRRLRVSSLQIFYDFEHVSFGFKKRGNISSQITMLREYVHSISCIVLLNMYLYWFCLHQGCYAFIFNTSIFNYCCLIVVLSCFYAFGIILLGYILLFLPFCRCLPCGKYACFIVLDFMHILVCLTWTVVVQRNDKCISPCSSKRRIYRQKHCAEQISLEFLYSVNRGCLY